MADRLCELAAEDEARGRLLSAGEKYNRAATYYLTCERLQAHGLIGGARFRVVSTAVCYIPRNIAKPGYPFVPLLRRLLLLFLVALLVPSAAMAQPRGPLVLAAASLQEVLNEAADAWAAQRHPRPVIAFALAR